MRPKQLVLAFAATSLALCALGGVGVSSAMAETPNNSCKGANIAGQGSSLQLIAQEKVWIPGFGEHACQGGVPVVTYTGSGSAAGLTAFGVGKVETPASSKDAFIASDDAPNAMQLDEIEEAANGKLSVPGEEQALVIPVLQAAIAIIVHPPAECLISTLRNHDLQEIWSGKTLEWSEIDNVTEMTPGACKHPITRVTRFDGSGTTYQFKHYLFEINGGLLPGTEKKGTLTEERNWKELQPETEKNLEWPESEGSVSLSPVVKPLAKGGAEEVKEVRETEGSIGYANLGDAREQYEAGKLEWVEVQTNGSKTLAEEGGENATYAPPGTASPEPGATAADANCENTEYTGIPAKPEDPDQDWSETYGEHPNVITGHYPICTLTWDVALANYELAGFGATASEIGQSAYDYLNYVVSSGASGGGQAQISNKHDYLGLTPTVQKDAEDLTKKIAGGPRTAEAWKVNSKFILPGEEISATTVSGPVALFVGMNELITCEKIEDEDDLLNWGFDLMLEFVFVNCVSTGMGNCPSTITALPLGGVDWPTVLASSNLLISDMTFDYNEFNLNTHGICALTEEEEISGNLEGRWVSPSGEEAEFPGTGSATTLETVSGKEKVTLLFTDLYKATAGSIMTEGEPA